MLDPVAANRPNVSKVMATLGMERGAGPLPKGKRSRGGGGGERGGQQGGFLDRVTEAALTVVGYGGSGVEEVAMTVVGRNGAVVSKGGGRGGGRKGGRAEVGLEWGDGAEKRGGDAGGGVEQRGGKGQREARGRQRHQKRALGHRGGEGRLE